MKKLYQMALGLLLFTGGLSAQDFLPYVSSNYAGVTGIDANPANVVDSRFKVDVSLAGFSLRASNNYIGIKKEAFVHDGPLLPPNNTTNFPAFADTLFTDHYLVERNNGHSKSVFVSNQVDLPSFMVSLNEKNAFAFNWKVRTYVNVDGIEEPLALFSYNALDYQALSLQQLENKRVSIQAMSWAEYGITYGRVIMDKEENFLKVGAKVKLLQGLGAMYFFADDLQYMVHNDSVLSFFKSNINYGHSTNFEFSQDGLKYNFTSHPGIGFDLGAVYEWRPDWQKYKYDMDGETNLWMRYKNKYKLKVGLSITDIGSIKYDKGNLSHNFVADINSWNIKHITLSDSMPVQSWDTLITNNFQQISDEKTFRMNLPTAFSLQTDYNVYKDFYVNLTGNLALRWLNNDTKVHEISTISLSPRWDYKWFGVFVPVSYNNNTALSVGTGLRLGPLVLGTNDIGALLMKRKETYGADFHLALKVPIMYRPVKDRDKDKISDKKDQCKDVPGVWEFKGCPDRDGDHVADAVDVCPDEPGLASLNGCPDRDGDGITDKQDACPDDKGLAEFNGCPDRDGDKIIDKDDDCPDEAGLAEFKGCPDRDGDKLIDKLDRCPDKAGPIDNEGCPETLLHLLDNAVSKKQISSSRKSKEGDFFPYSVLPADSACVFQLEGDNVDGVNEVTVIVSGSAKKAFRDQNDKLFRFPQKPKPPAPVVLTKQEEEVLKKAFDNLEFETGKDIIRSSSFASLDELAALMKKKPTWKLKIAGHTDNQGKPAANMKLSEKRAKAVKAYLASKGVAEANLLPEWYGQTKPIASNKTPEGRQKNRRVEMTIMD